MALHLIRCIGMSEEEMARIEAVLKHNPLYERNGFSASGTADEAAIESLEAQGIILERMPDSSDAVSLHWLEPRLHESELRAMDALGPGPDSPLRGIADRGTERFLLQFNRDPTVADRAELERLGIQLGEYVPDFAYKAVLDPEQQRQVVDVGSLRRVVRYDLAMTAQALGQKSLAQGRQIAEPVLAGDEDFAFPTIRERTFSVIGIGETMRRRDEPAMYNIRCHDSADLGALADALQEHPRIVKVERGRNRLRITLDADADAEQVAMEIAALPQVSVIEPFEYPKPDCEFVRRVLAIDDGDQQRLPWNGEDQIVGVIDSGVDTRHPDLVGRIALTERVAPEAPDDPLGHGTHVCGIIAGDGSASGGRIRGIAPRARLLVHAIRDAHGRYSGLPIDHGTMFGEIYDAGARILNCSWGVSVEALYTSDAYEMDQFIHEHPDMLIVVAAGNDGRQPEPPLPTDPFARIDYGSISSPATAKNALTVGASCSSRDDGPFRAENRWERYPGRHPPSHPPLSLEPINGDPGLMAAFSSRGPTDDTRIKPDLVAPGTAILAARSAPSQPRFPETAFGSHYNYNSGTSMAAPVAAGAAALVRQYYIAERGQQKPSAALLKATLINGAQWLPAQTVQDAAVGMPNFHQGFGRLDLLRSLPLPDGSSGFSLRFVDIGNNDALALDNKTPGRSAWKKRIEVEAGQPLRLTLCWTDHPAHGLQNRITLLLSAPTGKKSIGNAGMVRPPFEKTDRYNNVERIEIDAPDAGIWTVMVMGENIVFGKQGFGLVATGAISDFF